MFEKSIKFLVVVELLVVDGLDLIKISTFGLCYGKFSTQVVYTLRFIE